MNRHEYHLTKNTTYEQDTNEFRPIMVRFVALLIVAEFIKKRMTETG